MRKGLGGSFIKITQKLPSETVTEGFSPISFAYMRENRDEHDFFSTSRTNMSSLLNCLPLLFLVFVL